jgi:hypothetical protein
MMELRLSLAGMGFTATGGVQAGLAGDSLSSPTAEALGGLEGDDGVSGRLLCLRNMIDTF